MKDCTEPQGRNAPQTVFPFLNYCTPHYFKNKLLLPQSVPGSLQQFQRSRAYVTTGPLSYVHLYVTTEPLSYEWHLECQYIEHQVRLCSHFRFRVVFTTNHLHCRNELSAKPHVATCYTSGQATKRPWRKKKIKSLECCDDGIVGDSLKWRPWLAEEYCVKRTGHFPVETIRYAISQT